MTAREFILRLPDRVRPEVIEGMETVFHFDIDGPEGGKYTVTIRNGACSSEEGLNGTPRCSVASDSETFMDVVSGSTNAMLAVLRGKIKITNQGEMLKYARIFGIL